MKSKTVASEVWHKNKASLENRHIANVFGRRACFVCLSGLLSVTLGSLLGYWQDRRCHSRGLRLTLKETYRLHFESVGRADDIGAVDWPVIEEFASFIKRRADLNLPASFELKGGYLLVRPAGSDFRYLGITQYLPVVDITISCKVNVRQTAVLGQATISTSFPKF